MASDREIVEVLMRDVLQWKPELFACGVYYVAPDGCRRVAIFDDSLTDYAGWDLESWADAGMVAEALAKREIYVRVQGCAEDDWFAFVADIGDDAQAQTGPRAISLAAYEWATRQKEGRE